MKLTFVILTTCLLHASANVVSQNVSFSGKDVRLETVFSAVEKQTGFIFIYKESALKVARPVTITVQNVPVERFLEAIFKDQSLKYDIRGQNIIIYPKPAALSSDRQQPNGTFDPLKDTSIDITGRVVDEQNDPIEGVTVTVKRTDKKTLTNKNGEFSLEGIDKNAILVFTHVSLEAFEEMVSGRTKITVHLKPRITALGDITLVVNTGYQQVGKERTVGSYSKVDSALFHRQVSTDLVSRLNGITNSLLFDTHIGTNQHLQIRGISTIQSGAEPLIVLDNFPYAGSIDNINPNDIADITVLKDAAAASVWGAKAGNGVIIITTKKGKYNQPIRLQLNTNVSVQQKPDLFYFPQMSSSDFIDVETFLFGKGAYTSNLSNTTTRPIVSPVVEILNKLKNSQISQAEADAQINTLRGNDIRNDYAKYVYRNAVNQQHYLSASGGSNTISYNISGGFDKNLPLIKAPGAYNRYSLNAGAVFKPARPVEISTSVVFTQSDRANVFFAYPLNPLGGKSQLYPYAQLADASGNHLAIPYKYRLAYADTVGAGQLLDWHYRPLDELANQNNHTKSEYVLINVGAKVNLLSWLNAEIKYQYGSQTDNQEQLNDINSFYTRDLVNSYTNVRSTVASTRNPVPVGGILDKSITTQITRNLRGQINVSKNWHDHELTGLVATEIGQIKTQNFGDRIYGFDNNTLVYSTQVDYNTSYPLYMGGASRVPGSNLNYSGTINRSASLLTNISYRYNKKYTIYASGRKDGSNFFGVDANNRWKPLWSAGIGWDITKESFYQLDFMPTLRLRASYGYTGNINNSIPAVTIISYGAMNPITATPTASLTYAQNPDLRWEQVGITNLGVDFGFLDNRITGSFEWFEKRSRDVIARFPIDPSLGISLSQTTLNAANLETKGFDVQVNAQNLKGKISWRTTANFSYAKTIVTNYFQNPILGIPTIGDINPAKGNIAWGLYAYRWAGLDPSTGDPQGYLAKQISKNYTGIMNDSFQNHLMMGSSLPLYFGNLLNSISYKGIELSANIIYKFAYYYRKPTIHYTNLFNSWMGNSDYAKRWQAPGDENRTNVPSMIYPVTAARDAFFANSEVNVEKGDHIRLNDLRLSYSFQNRNFKKLPLKTLQAFIYASNLNLYIWKASKLDYNPDYATSTIPPQRTISLGMSVVF